LSAAYTGGIWTIGPTKLRSVDSTSERENDASLVRRISPSASPVVVAAPK